MYIVLEIAELLCDNSLLPSLATPHVLVRIIAIAEGYVWWPIILTKEVAAVSATC